MENLTGGKAIYIWALIKYIFPSIGSRLWVLVLDCFFILIYPPVYKYLDNTEWSAVKKTSFLYLILLLLLVDFLINCNLNRMISFLKLL